MSTTNPNPLAVMDAAISDPDNADTNDLVWARAAVAELVAAASAGSDMPVYGDKNRVSLYFNPEKAARLRAALARVGGAA